MEQPKNSMWTSAALGLLRRLAKNRAGNTMAIVAASVAPLLALVGGGIDMGRSYLSEARLQQACDSGVLAARKKLGSTEVLDGAIPADAETVGNRFFDVNYRDGAYGSENLAFAMELEDDYSISGVATVDVPTTIMKLFGDQKVALTVNCAAKLNFSNTDIMMVLDTTTSMGEKNPSDPKPKITVMKDVVRNFYSQVEGSKGPGTRIRYGFVPYSTNVNVGALLEDDWVVDDWHYRSRENAAATSEPGTSTSTQNWTATGTVNDSVHQTYSATMHPPANEWGSPYKTCDTAPPGGNATWVPTYDTPVTEPYSGPPAGDKVTQHVTQVANGIYYWVQLEGNNCVIYKRVYTNYTESWDWVTIPVIYNIPQYRYRAMPKNVVNWRTETAGCMEERGTYEIDDYSAVDFTRALDLDLDLVPDALDPDTQWRPMYPNIIWEPEMSYWGESGSFKDIDYTTSNPDFFMPNRQPPLIACPQAAMKLAEIDTVDDFNAYINPLAANGTTYHDIGMIWGGRLISPTGLFAADNADETGKPTNRHLIFLTDGITEPFDVAYGAYSVEPLEKRRWSKTSTLTLKETVEARFAVACEQVHNLNVTVWVVGFGTDMTDLMKQCAGDGHWFQANDATQLQEVFNKIAGAMGDLRISK